MQSFVTEPGKQAPASSAMELLIITTERTWMSIALDDDEYLDVQFDAEKLYLGSERKFPTDPGQHRCDVHDAGWQEIDSTG